MTLSFLAAGQALRLWDWRPGTPFSLEGDATFVNVQIRAIVEHGWYGENPDVGAPLGQNSNWFPYTGVIHFAVLKLLGALVDSPFTAGALYFMAGFPLAALSMYWLARHVGCIRPAAVMAGVLFSVVPGHQLKYGHLFLASYWAVPFAVALVFWAASGRPFFVRLPNRDLIDEATRRALVTNAGTLLMIATVALGDVYYTAFTLILLTVAMVVRRAARVPLHTFRGPALAGGLMAGLAVATLFPALARTKADLVTGRLPAKRLFGESETYAGKLMDLMLPWVEHRLEPLSFLTFAYNVGTVPTVERPALGVVALAGVVGLIWSVIAFLLVPGRRRASPLTATMAALTLVCLAFYTRGGLGSFVALFATPQIRTWSRLFLFIALLGLLAAGLWLSAVARRRGRRFGWAVAALLLTVGVLDQTNPDAAPDYVANRKLQSDLLAFTGAMEARLPRACAVFQLPVARFPEEPPPGSMTNYDHFLPYLASEDLRWSYGATKGTSRADWQLALTESDVPRLLDDLAAAGYCSVQVDRFGYKPSTDPSRAIEAWLGAPIAETSDKRRVAYDLQPRRADLLTRLGADGVAQRRAHVFGAVVVHLSGGQVEEEDGHRSQWIGPQAELSVYNMSAKAVEGLTLTMVISGPDRTPREISVQRPTGERQSVTVSAFEPESVALTFTAQPGKTVVRISTEAPPVQVSKTQTRLAAAKVADITASAGPSINIGVLQSLPQ